MHATRTDTSLYRATRFWLTSHARRPHVGNEPWFDAPALAYFKSLLSRPGVNYLEFGSGGSTVYASHHVATLVSVESDARYLAAVQRKIGACDAELIPVDIGLTHDWGRPVFVKPTPRRLARWRRYPQAPWPAFERRGMLPDVVLVDGRFRVACALETLLRVGPECVVLVDDYAGRPQYAEIGSCAELIAMKGRMAVFRAPPDLDRDRCARVLQTHYSVFL
jgi:hypothetical protein